MKYNDYSRKKILSSFFRTIYIFDIFYSVIVSHFLENEHSLYVFEERAECTSFVISAKFCS